MRFYYSNQDDPRVFVYRDENGPSGYGVTLNFAHRKAVVLTILWLVLLIVPSSLLFIYAHTSLILTLLMAIFMLGAVVSIGIIAYRGAAQDLKKFPGLKSARDGKGSLVPFA